ncbi:MAG: hypothetical protein QXW82_06800 [Candidatus Bathyarchaeia archaeon]
MGSVLARKTALINVSSIIMIMLLISLSLIPLFIAKTNAYPQLWVNVATNKFYYTYRDVVHIYGNVTYSGNLVNEGLVAIQVRNPNSNMIITRTVPAQRVPSTSWEIEIISFYPCDMNGKPKDTFGKPGTVYFNVTVKNNVYYSREILITITVCDFDYTTIGIAALQTTIPARGAVSYLTDIYIDPWVSTGTGIAYASVWSNWLHMLGIPYCPEKTTNFNIGKAITPSPIPTTNISSYHAAFRLNPLEPIGDYEIRVCAFHAGLTAIGAGGFTMPFQLLGDVIYDRHIDILDVVTVTAAYDSESGSPYWNPQADVELNGKIDICDVTKVTSQYDKNY